MSWTPVFPSIISVYAQSFQLWTCLYRCFFPLMLIFSMCNYILWCTYIIKFYNYSCTEILVKNHIHVYIPLLLLFYFGSKWFGCVFWGIIYKVLFIIIVGPFLLLMISSCIHCLVLVCLYFVTKNYHYFLFYSYWFSNSSYRLN